MHSLFICFLCFLFHPKPLSCPYAVKPVATCSSGNHRSAFCLWMSLLPIHIRAILQCVVECVSILFLVIVELYSIVWIYQILLYFLNIFIDYAITVVPFPPFTQLHPAYPVPPTFPPYSSCPWVIHISSLAYTFPTLFLPSPIFHLSFMLLILCTFPPSLPLPLPYW